MKDYMEGRLKPALQKPMWRSPTLNQSASATRIIPAEHLPIQGFERFCADDDPHEMKPQLSNGVKRFKRGFPARLKPIDLSSPSSHTDSSGCRFPFLCEHLVARLNC
jgi:hypothetical protein